MNNLKTDPLLNGKRLRFCKLYGFYFIAIFNRIVFIHFLFLPLSLVDDDDDDDVEGYFCTVCDIKIPDVYKHIQQFHTGQEVILQVITANITNC